MREILFYVWLGGFLCHFGCTAAAAHDDKRVEDRPVASISMMVLTSALWFLYFVIDMFVASGFVEEDDTQ